MKNKKGFTLIEILVVIVIIGVIMSIAIPAAMAISNSIKERSYTSKMNTYLAAAELYAKNNKDVFGESTVIQISVETLLAYGYADSEYSCGRAYGCIADPRNDSNVINDEPITIKRNNTIYQAILGPMEVELILSFIENGAASISSTGVGCETHNGSSCDVTLPTITRSGYTILGWNKVSSSTTATYAPGETISIYENGTYYAITSKSVLATFNKNTASSITFNSANCTMYNTQTSCTVTSPSITAQTNYTVVGWNTNSAATTKLYDSAGIIPISASITYYAIQKPPVNCIKAATANTTYSCSSGTLEGTQCLTTTAASIDSHVYSKCWDRDDADRVYCTGTHGGSYAELCETGHSCDNANGYYYCRYRCTSDYVCNGVVVSSSTCSTYTAATATTTYSCSLGVIYNTTSCRLTNQASCPAGWTEQ